MRLSRSVVVFAITVLTLTLDSNAQKFQEPTKDELQMTADPKAPGASAVILYREETTDNRSHYISSYVRIKVLTELGKEWATVQVPYDAGSTATPIIEGRTIHSDGTVIPLTGKASDLLVFKTIGANVKAATFNLPSVEVGSILEYKWTVPLTGGSVSGESDADEGTFSSMMASSIPVWNVQHQLFAHREHFYYNPKTDMDSNVLGSDVTYFVDGERASYLLYTQHLPAGAQVSRSTKDDFTLDIRDVPAIQSESNAPPASSMLYRVRFYYTPYTTPTAYWENEIKRWSGRLNDFAGQTNAIKDAADQITAGAATPEAKARKLYDAVQAFENTDFTRQKSDVERAQLHMKKQVGKAQDVLAEKSGSGNSLAALYLALARAAGLEAYGVQVADRDQRIFDPNYLSLDQLDTLLVLLKLDGKDVYLDPGQKLCPFGLIHWSHSLAGGLAQNSKVPAYTPPNLTKDAITARSANLTLDPQGNVTGTIQILMNGPAAMRWRQLALTADSAEAQKQFNGTLHEVLPQGIAGEVDHFQGLDTAATNLLAVVKVSGSLATVTGKRLIMPGFFFSAGSRTQFLSDTNRTAPIDLHYAEQVIDDVILHLPAGYSVESAPPPTQLPWPDHAALVVKTTSAPGVIDIKHIFARAFILLDAKEYPALHDYYQKLATNDQQQLVVAPAAAPGAAPAGD